MANQLQEREGFKKYVGYFEADVVAVNPDLEKLSSLGIELEKEPVYTKEVDDKEKDEEGNSVVVGQINQTSVVFYLKDKKTGKIFNTRFFLKNKLRKKSDTGKVQFMNSQGSSGWAVNEGGLLPFMTKNGQSIRRAYDGESDLYDFVKTWLNNADYTKDFELIFDWKKLMNGNVKEIASYVNSGVAGSILCPATVRVADDGTAYQQVYNKGIVNGYTMKQVRVKKIDEDFIERAAEKKKALAEKVNNAEKLSTLERSVLGITDGGGQYACKDFYYLGELKEYDEKENFVASGKDVDPEDGSY